MFGLFFWFKPAGKGGKDISFTIGKYGEIRCVASFLIETDLVVAFKYAIAAGMVGCVVLGAIFGLPYIVEYAADGYAEFSCSGVAWYFMVMPFEDVDQGRRAEVVIEFLEFLFAHVWYLAECSGGEIADPLLDVGEGVEEADEFRFIQCVHVTGD